MLLYQDLNMEERLFDAQHNMFHAMLQQSQRQRVEHK